MDIEEQYDRIYRYCYFRLYDRQLAQDITQETFLRFYRQGLNLDKSRELPYLYTIARHLCIDEFRRKNAGGRGGAGAGLDVGGFGINEVSRDDAPTGNTCGEAVSTESMDKEMIGLEGIRRNDLVDGPGGMAGHDSSESWIDSMVLRAVIGKLPREEQELLFLRYVNEVSVASICQVMGISRFAVYRRLSKVLKRLKKELIKEGFSE